MTPHGQFHWNELMTRDAAKAKAFYGGTIGWSFNEMNMMENPYYVCMDGEKPVAGIFTMSGPEMEAMPEHWFTYLAVDDVDTRVEKAVAHGATVLRPAFDVPGIGRIVILQDPGGAVMGWMTPAQEN